MATTSLNPRRFRRAVAGFAELVTEADEATIVARGSSLLEDLVGSDDWLPDAFASVALAGYRQYLLHCDARERFSIVSFVWGPGQATPVHDHGVWGLVGVMRAIETSQHYRHAAAGGLEPVGSPAIHRAGSVCAVSPSLGDIHRVSNSDPVATAVSIHVYGGNIGRIERRAFDDDGSERPFVSGYSADVLPNFWDRDRQSGTGSASAAGA